MGADPGSHTTIQTEANSPFPEAGKNRKSSGAIQFPRNRDISNKASRWSPEAPFTGLVLTILEFCKQFRVADWNSWKFPHSIPETHLRTLTVTSDTEPRGGRSVAQGCYQTNLSDRGVLSAWFCCSQGRGIAPTHQPPEIKQIYLNTSFQDGVYCQWEECDPEARLHREIGLERCLSFSPHCKGASNISQVYL